MLKYHLGRSSNTSLYFAHCIHVILEKCMTIGFAHVMLFLLCTGLYFSCSCHDSRSVNSIVNNSGASRKPLPNAATNATYDQVIEVKLPFGDRQWLYRTKNETWFPINLFKEQTGISMYCSISDIKSGSLNIVERKQGNDISLLYVGNVPRALIVKRDNNYEDAIAVANRNRDTITGIILLRHNSIVTKTITLIDAIKAEKLAVSIISFAGEGNNIATLSRLIRKIDSIDFSFLTSELDSIGIPNLSKQKQRMIDAAESLASLWNVECVSIRSDRIEMKDIISLIRSNRLRGIDIRAARVSDSDIHTLLLAKRLETLFVKIDDNVKVDISMLGKIKTLTDVKIEVHDVAIDLSFLHNLPKLSRVYIFSDNAPISIKRSENVYASNILQFQAVGRGVGDSIFDVVAKAIYLRSIHFMSTAISDVGIKSMRHINTLRDVYMFSVRVGDSLAKIVRNNKYINNLILNRTDIGDDVVMSASELRYLHLLDLSFTKISDKCINYLNMIDSQYILKIRGTSITDNGMNILCHSKSGGIRKNWSFCVGKHR